MFSYKTIAQASPGETCKPTNELPVVESRSVRVPSYSRGEKLETISLEIFFMLGDVFDGIYLQDAYVGSFWLAESVYTENEWMYKHFILLLEVMEKGKHQIGITRKDMIQQI